MAPLRIRAAAALLGLFGIGLIVYTVNGPPLIDPLFWLLGAAGLVLLSLVAKPYRSA